MVYYYFLIVASKANIRVLIPGNLLNRTLGLLKKNCQSTLPIDSSAAAEGNAFKDTVENLVSAHVPVHLSALHLACSLTIILLILVAFCHLKVQSAQTHYENLALSSACETVVEIGNAGNLYINEQAPWSSFKLGGAASEAAAKVIFLAL